MEENRDYNRSVTSLDWNPMHPELFLASYSKLKTWSLDEADGLINIYSIAMQTRPEHTLNCQYEVTKAIFNPFNSNMVIGATSAGYILRWDLRAQSGPVQIDMSQPTQKTCQAMQGHQHRVHALSVVGSQNAHNIMSISNDGKLCQWKPNSFSEPALYFDLMH